jgi:hypothetical protein
MNREPPLGRILFDANRLRVVGQLDLSNSMGFGHELEKAWSPGSSYARAQGWPGSLRG